MSEERLNWPLLVGITAGIVGGIVAAVVLHSVRNSQEPEMKLRDAHEIIAQCHDKIKEIEADLETLKQPLQA